MTDPARPTWLPAYAALTLLWGSSFLLISTALDSLVPAQVAFGRLAIGATVLAVLLLVRRERVRLPRRRLLDVLIAGAAMSGVPFLLVAEAQTRLTTILAGLLNATTPLFAAIFVAVLVPAERPDRRQLAGLLIGFVGIGVLLGVWNTGSIDLVGGLLMIAATACYGFGTVWSRARLSGTGLSAVALPALQLGMSVLVLLPFVVASPIPVEVSPTAAGALLILGVGGTGLAYVLFWRVLNAAGSTVAASVTYAVPVVSTTLGVLVLGETLHWYEPVGGVVVLAGVALTQVGAIRAQRLRAATASTTAPAAATRPPTRTRFRRGSGA